MELLNVNTVIVPLLMGLMGFTGVVLVKNMVAANRMRKSLEAYRESVEGALAEIRSEMEGLRAEMGGLRLEIAQMRAEMRGEIAKVDSPPDPLG